MAKAKGTCVDVATWGELVAAAASTPVAVCDVYTSWCGPCKIAAPIVVELAASNPDITFIKANLELPGLSKLSTELGISSIPTFLVYKDGSVTATITGLNFAAVKDAVESAGGTLTLTEAAQNAGGSMCGVM